jgi:hypothetical protein
MLLPKLPDLAGARHQFAQADAALVISLVYFP